LIKTKFGRRFIHHPGTLESFWKIPEGMLQEGVQKFDELESRQGTDVIGPEGDVTVEEEEEPADDGTGASGQANSGDAEAASTRGVKRPAPAEVEGEDYQLASDEEYEDEAEEREKAEESAAKRLKTDDGPQEFTEDDIAYQLAAMGEEYGLAPGEYGEAEDGEEWDEADVGAELTEADSKFLFMDMLDDYRVNPFTTWDKIVEEGKLVDDDRYTALPNMKSRKETWDEWSASKIQTLKEEKEKREKKDVSLNTRL
jgi:FF domain